MKPLMPFAIRSSRALFTRALFLYFAFALTAAPAFADGASGVTNIFKPDGTPARAIFNYTMLVLAICAAIFVIVAGLRVYTVARFRRRSGNDEHEPPQVYGSNQIELAWTVLPILIVFVLSLVTARMIAEVQNATPPPKASQVTVASPNPILLVYWRSLALPPLFISLFVLNQWLKRWSAKGGKR